MNKTDIPETESKMCQFLWLSPTFIMLANIHNRLLKITFLHHVLTKNNNATLSQKGRSKKIKSQCDVLIRVLD